MSVAKVLLVDDHQVVLGGIKAALSEYADVEVVGEATDGRKALRHIESLRPDIVIMDLAMPHFNGIEATYQIKQMDPKIKVIIFTMYSYREFIKPLVKSGISGYVLKESPISDLYMAIKVVRRGGSYFTEDIHEFLLNLGEDEKDRFDLLSPREREVFQLLAEGLSTRQAGELLFISPKTVETHKYHIMDKLQIRTMAEWITEAIRRNIITGPNLHELEVNALACDNQG
ncbi:MAG: response regulator [Candidatus Hodarchaeota archaeon]